MDNKKTITLDDIPEVEVQEESKQETKTDETFHDSLVLTSKYSVGVEDTFKIEFGILNFQGRWRVVDESRLDQIPEAEKHWVEFKMWDYSLQSWIRNKSSEYDPRKRIHIVDKDLQDRIKLQRLLKKWSFQDDDKNLTLHLVEGVLTDGSWEAVSKLHPTILTFIIDRMNDVLEHNG